MLVFLGILFATPGAGRYSIDEMIGNKARR